MGNTKKQPKSTAASAQNEPDEILNPKDIKITKEMSEDQKEKAIKQVDEWFEDLRKQFLDIADQNNIEELVICWRHPGTKDPTITTKGNLYETAKLSAMTAGALRKAVNKQLEI